MSRKLVLAAALCVASGTFVDRPFARGFAAATDLPVPADVFGFAPGTDRRLADFGQITEFFRRLDKASDRVQTFEIGRTAEGRQMILAAISSKANLRDLARYRDIAAQLADSRGLNDETARALARQGKTIVWVDMGLHATEVAHAQVSAEVARHIASDAGEEMQRVRENAIVLLMPVMNPDGLDIVTKWYRANVGTRYETSPLPVLYQKHAGHDNNRDWFMQNLPETRNVTRQLYREWHPQILYNHHQSGQMSPRIWAPPMDDPVNPNMHPLVNRGISLLGVGIMQRLEQEGKIGSQGYSTYSNWWNGGMRSTPCFHNIVGILTETASGRYATPVEVSAKDLPQTLASGENATEPSTWNPSPWRGGAWKLRDQMDYMFTATMAVLRLAAEYREDWLYNRYQMARDHMAAGTRGGPFAYVIPPDQHDWPTAVRLAEILSLGAVEIHRATAEFEADGKRHPAGSLVVPMAQPYRAFAKDLLEPQRHPDRRQGPAGPPKRPYDMAGWTLPYQMGVRAERVDRRFSAKLIPVTDFAALLPNAEVPNARFALDRRVNNTVTAVMRLAKAGARVSLTSDLAIVDGPPAAAHRALIGLGLRIETAPAAGAGRSVRVPRVGLYKSHVASMDEGWTRFVFEQFEVPYERVTDREIRGGNLRARFDAIVLPDQSADSILNGHGAGSMPPEYVGGVGAKGAMALKTFVEAGGTLIALDEATAFAIRSFGLPVRNVLDGVRNTEFYCPGSLLRLEIDTAHPMGAGLQPAQAGFFVNGRAFEPNGAGAEAVRTVARYAASDLLMSGWINGADRITGKGAVLDVPLGQGRVVLIGFGTQFRGQPHGTFKLLFNPILESAATASGRKSEQ